MSRKGAFEAVDRALRSLYDTNQIKGGRYGSFGWGLQVRIACHTKRHQGGRGDCLSKVVLSLAEQSTHGAFKNRASTSTWG